MINKIEQLRKTGKLSKRELATLAGVSEAQYYRYIKGSAMPIETAEKLIKALGYKLAIILEL